MQINIYHGLKDSTGCCNLEYPLTCPYSTTSWQATTSGSFPDLSNYPGFSWGSNYFWTQNKGGELDFTQSLSVNQYTVFSADYYFNPSELNSGNYLHFFFVPDSNPDKKVLIGSVTLNIDEWFHLEMPCNSSKTNYCCGDPVSFPCTGKLEVIGALPSAPLSLYAVDNIGTCQGEPDSTSTSVVSTTTSTTVTSPLPPTTTTVEVTTETTPATTQTTTILTTTQTTTIPTTTQTTTIPTTTHPPTQPECCEFETDTCDWTIVQYWTLSSVILPTTLPPDHDSDYLWTTSNAATITSNEIYGVTESTEFSLVYYVNGDSGNDGIFLGFQEDGATDMNVLAFLTNTGDNWMLITVDCSPQPFLSSPGCCLSYPCSGKIVIESTVVSANLLFAVDNADFNGGCHDSFPCCYFDDGFLCGFSNQDDAGIGWQWSGSTPPVAPPTDFPETSGYIWFQATEANTFNQSQTFKSSLINIYPETILTIKAFVEAGNKSTPNLTVSINFIDNGKRYNVYFYYQTPAWQVQTATDLYSHSGCTDLCSAYVEIMASAYEVGNFYAVDTISTTDESNCAISGNKNLEARFHKYF